MAITYRGAGAAAAANSGGNITPALFESPTAGDLLLCLAVCRDGATDLSVSGWSERFDVAPVGVSRDPRMGLFWKIAAGADAAPTVVTTGANTGDTTIGQCCAFRGTHQTTPFDTDGTTYGPGAELQDIGPILGITPTANDAVVIVMGGKSDDWTSVATLSGDSLTWVEIGDPSSGTGNDVGMVWDYAIISGAPVTISSKTFTVTGGLARDAVGKMTSIKPPDSFVPRYPAINHQNPGVLCKAHNLARRWKRHGNGVFLPDTITV